MASEGDYPFISPTCHVMHLVEGNIPRRLKAFHDMFIAWGLELIHITYDVMVEIKEGPSFLSSPIRLYLL